MSNKILIISQNFYPEVGSAGNRIKNLYLQLKKNDHDVDVLTTEPTYPNKNIYTDDHFWDDEELNTDQNINRIKVSNKTYSRRILNRLFYYLKIAFKMLFFIIKDKQKYDVVLVTSPPIFIGFVGLIAKYRYRSKLILDVRDLWPDSLVGVGVFDYKIVIKVLKWLEKKLYKGSDEIIVNSEGFIQYITENAQINRDDISFIPNAANKSELASTIHHREEEFNVIYVGNIGMAQDVDILIKVAKELEQHHIHLNVIGYGVNQKEFVNECKVKRLTNITVKKPVSRKDCLNLMAEHQVGIVTLNNSNVFQTVLPGKVIDYMICGVPIVASVSGLSKRTIERANVGFVSEDRNVSDMVNYILLLKNNPDLRRKVSENGKAFVKDHFLWEKNIKKILELVRVKKQSHIGLSSYESNKINKVGRK
ncbi:glycosyltransferase WbuB [Salipaludibacillus keqinensis]|uniref:Glycosyltransferase WbuB n=1 Tax=Salipaludibacillus keqinensis TaxID=2045207 RepID=A0A323TAP4_9BACI|nr:glycosyltransferase family 4 protein [Salipaludibacillus keqinensis]PYZ92592.1 glycosyltransferase WbuB [Salipaludibacillus keqinensis]